jgi:hypothetical protein
MWGLSERANASASLLRLREFSTALLSKLIKPGVVDQVVETLAGGAQIAPFFGREFADSFSGFLAAALAVLGGEQ